VQNWSGVVRRLDGKAADTVADAIEDVIRKSS
jgi:hypothetical protein